MRDDLLEARNALRWAETHIPELQQRFIAWQRLYPYELVMEPDPKDVQWEFMVAYLRAPLDPLIIGDVGAILNSMRTALDILMFAVLARHRKKPKGKTHFPICSRAADFLAAVNMLESKKRIVAIEATAIKNTQAYRGGDPSLYAIHQLDILRKHTRLLVIEPSIEAVQIFIQNSASYIHRRVMDDKTILYRLPYGRFRPTEGNTLAAAQIFLNEPALLTAKQPTMDVLRTFAARVRRLIEEFP